MNWFKSKENIINECKSCAIRFPKEVQKDSLGDVFVSENKYSLLKENRQIIREERRQRYGIAYLESLLKLTGIREKDIAKKNKYRTILNAKLPVDEKTNISLICSVADITRDSFYKYCKSLKKGNSENEHYISYLSDTQDETGYCVGYRRMTKKIRTL